MSKILIHQPEYIPWVNFFLRIKYCDIYVILDDVQYSRRSFQNRNIITNSNKDFYLTVPIKKNKFNAKINEIKIDYSEDWIDNHLKAVTLSYKKYKNFAEIFFDYKRILNKKFKYLADLNIELINIIIQKFQFNCKIFLSSELDIKKKKSSLILEICKKLNANQYITGEGSKKYLIEKEFLDNKIDIKYIDNKREFNLSILDYLFKEGYNKDKILL